MLCEVNDANDLLYALNEFKDREKLILGGGSNILLTRDVSGVVIKNSIKGIERIKEDDRHVWIKAGAGEVWHDLVMYCIRNDLAGIENLSLIPGCVGAGPMQNIGAYGVELKDVFDELHAMQISDFQVRKFNNHECKFGYRESIFKNKLKAQYIITSVTLRLNRQPVFNTKYGAIEQELQRMGVTELSVKAISDAVINIRRSKLPDPAVLGNAGSFFKNPEVTLEHYGQLKADHPDIVAYPTHAGKMKLAAGWLIEQAGWKGKRVGNTGSHKDQALVLVNYGNATGNEIYKLALDIKDSVFQKFGVNIEPEVNII